jgi:hypothetical protein
MTLSQSSMMTSPARRRPIRHASEPLRGYVVSAALKCAQSPDVDCARQQWSRLNHETQPTGLWEPSECERIALNKLSRRNALVTLTDHNGHPMADDLTEIRCPICGSPALRYPKVMNDDKPVICAGCGAVVST